MEDYAVLVLGVYLAAASEESALNQSTALTTSLAVVQVKLLTPATLHKRSATTTTSLVAPEVSVRVRSEDTAHQVRSARAESAV